MDVFMIGVLFIALLVYIIALAVIIKELVYFDYQNIMTVIQSVALFLFIRYFSLSSSKSPGSIKNKVYSFFKNSFMFKIIFTISTFSYGIYLAHYISLYSSKWIDKYYYPVYSHNPVIWLPIMIIAFLAVTILILWILNKIPGLRNVSGAH